MSSLSPAFQDDQAGNFIKDKDQNFEEASEIMQEIQAFHNLNERILADPDEPTYFPKSVKKISFSSQKAFLCLQAENCLCLCFKQTVMQLYKRQQKIIIPFIWGILVGIAFTALVFQQQIIMTNSASLSTADPKIKLRNAYRVTAMNLINGNHWPTTRNYDEDAGTLEDLITWNETKEFPSKSKLFVGVITAEKFLGTRATAVNNTWGKLVDGLEFYAQFGTPAKYRVPVVNLDHVSDSEYPPQRKAFEMLKYVCRKHIDHFEWFIRADDDVYIRVEKLKNFLSKIDSDRLIYMGQPGHGVPEMRGKLGLKGHNFCMGGPGVMFNRKTLKALCPHIDDCIKEVVSTEEDVEIGRCVTNHLHIECTHAWEALKLFYHSYQEEYNEERPFLGNLVENEHVAPALTLHHIKLPTIMYKVHRHYNTLLLQSSSKKLETMKLKIIELESHLHTTTFNKLTLPLTTTEVSQNRIPKKRIPWKTFTTDAIYNLSPAHVVHDITNDVLADLKQICETAIDTALNASQVKTVTFNHVMDGSSRSDYQHGTDYHVDINYNRKSFVSRGMNEIRRIHLFRPVGSFHLSGMRRSLPMSNQMIFVIVYVSPANPTEFEIFMRNFYEPLFLAKKDFRSRLIAIYSKETSRTIRKWSLSPPVEEVIKSYRVRYPGTVFEIIPPIIMDGEVGKTDPYIGFAQGVLHVEKSLRSMGIDDFTKSVVLFTTTNITLSRSIVQTCYLRTYSVANDSDAFNNKFINYKARKTKDHHLPPQLYQPVPFHVYPAAVVGPWPTAMVPQSNGLKPGTGAVPLSMTKSDFGFWDVSSATGEEDEVIAPLCGRVEDLRKAAGAAIKSFNFTETKSSFQNALFEQIYAGKLAILRTPDRSYSSLRNR